MRYGRGLRRPTVQRVVHRMGAASHADIGAALKTGIRGSADLTPHFPANGNQVSTEICFAFSFAWGLTAALAIAGKPLGFVPSPQTLAALVYAKEQRGGPKPASGRYPELQDLGAELQDVADVASSWGVAPMGQIVGDTNADVGTGPYLPSPGAQGFPEADVVRVIEGSNRLIEGEYQIPINDRAPEVAGASLDAGIPVWVGGLVGQAYEDLGPNDIGQPTPANDTTAGGHAQVLCGYRTAPGGALEFRVWNSWGPRWAFNGTVWVSSDWVRSLWQAYPLAVAA